MIYPVVFQYGVSLATLKGVAAANIMEQVTGLYGRTLGVMA